MKFISKNLNIKIFLIINFFFFNYSLADNHNIYETLEQIQKDIQTLKKLFIRVPLVILIMN